MDSKSNVIINLYDLSMGMAKQYSPMFIGKSIDGIWHTGIVVYSTEYFFGGGICSLPPKQTPYGLPVKEIPLGETRKTRAEFLEFLRSISSKFSMETYDLFNNNCNNFTDTCSKFLLGVGIPEYITGLPQEVLKTPLGQMIKPLIDNLQQSMTQQAAGAQVFNNNNNNFDNANVNLPKEKAIEIDDQETFFQILEGNKAVAVNFYSNDCKDCLDVKPFYKRLAEEYTEIKFLMVNIEIFSDLSNSFEVERIPTFVFFWEMNLEKKVVGSDRKELQNCTIFLKQKLFALNEKEKIENKKNENQKANKGPIEFKLYKSIQPVFLYDSYKIDMPLQKLTTNDSPNYLKELKNFGFDKFSKSCSTEDKTKFVKFCLEGLSDLSQPNSIPYLDILKTLNLDKDCQKALLEDPWINKSIDCLIQKEIHRGNRLLILRLLVNFFSCEIGKKYVENQITQILSSLEFILEQFNTDLNCIQAVSVIINDILISFIIKDEEIITKISNLLIKIGNLKIDDTAKLAWMYSCIKLCEKYTMGLAILQSQSIDNLVEKQKISTDQNVESLGRDLFLVCKGIIQFN